MAVGNGGSYRGKISQSVGCLQIVVLKFSRLLAHKDLLIKIM